MSFVESPKHVLFCCVAVALLSFSCLAQDKGETLTRAPSVGIFYPSRGVITWRYGDSQPLYRPPSYGPPPASVPEVNWQDLMTQYKERTDKDPTDAVAFYNLGVAYIALDQKAAAAKAFEQAIKLNPNWTVAHYNLANVYADLSKQSVAIDEYKQVIKLDPKYQEAYFNLALSYLAQGATAEAKDQYKNLKALDSKEGSDAQKLAAKLEKALNN